MNTTQWTRDSLAGRLSLYFGAGTLLILGCLGTVLFIVFERQVQLRDTNELISKSAAVQQLLSEVNRPSDINRLVSRIHATEIGHQDLDIGLMMRGKWVLEPEKPIIDHALQQPIVLGTGVQRQMWFDIDDKHWTMLHFAYQMTSQPPEVLQAIVAIEVTDTVHLVASLRNALIAVGFAGAAMIAALTWVSTVRALAPLKRVAREAERMTAPAFGDPLSVTDAPIEVRGMVSSINQMLSRLQKSFNSLEQFSADIAHELRTPVNALLTQTQVTLSRERTNEEYREALHQSLEELNRFQRMVEDMLFIARADRNVNTRPFEDVNLTQTATEVVEYVELIASEKDQSISIEGALTAPGDALMLRRAITNLLTNAVRYSIPKTRILLTLFAESGRAVIRVENPYDEPLDKADIERLFDRFSRRSPAQSFQHAGLGLGLSIVQSIMRVHGGQATAGFESGQFWVQLTWPLAQPVGGQPAVGDRRKLTEVS